MINFQTQQKLKNEFMDIVGKILNKKIFSGNENMDAQSNTVPSHFTFTSALNLNANNNLTLTISQEKYDEFVKGYTNWIKNNQKELAYLLKNNLNAQEKSSFINQFLSYPDEIVLAFLDISKLNDDDGIFAVLLQKYDFIDIKLKTHANHSHSLINAEKKKYDVMCEIKTKLVNLFFNKYLNLIIANPIQSLKVIEDKMINKTSKSQFLLTKFEIEFKKLIEDESYNFNQMCEQLFSVNQTANNIASGKMYETVKNKLLRNLPLKMHYHFLEKEQKQLKTNIISNNDQKEIVLLTQPLSIVYLMIKELENDKPKNVDNILKNSERYYLNKKDNQKVELLLDDEVLKQLSKHSIFLKTKNIQYLLKKITQAHTNTQASNVSHNNSKSNTKFEFFSLELLKEQMSLKNNGFKQIFNIEKLHLLFDYISLSSMTELNEELFNQFFIFLFNQYDLEKEEKNYTKMINALINQYKKAHTKPFEIALNYEIKDTYVQDAPNPFEQILINTLFEEKKLPLTIFESLLKLIPSNPKKVKFENIIPLYSLAFNVVDEPILAIEKLHKKLSKIKDADYEGNLEKNMLSILAISDINFFSYSDIIMKIINQKLTLPLSKKSLKNVLIEQKLNDYTKAIQSKNNWNSLDAQEKSFYLSLRKVENKIQRQQQSVVMDTEELVKSFAPFKITPLDIPLKEKNKFSANQEHLIIKNSEYAANVISIEPILEQDQYSQMESYADEIKHLELPQLTQEIENFFYAKESLKKWVDTQDVINKKIYHINDALSFISPSLYAKLILSDDMLKEGILYLSDESETNMINEYKSLVQELKNKQLISLEDIEHLNHKMGF